MSKPRYQINRYDPLLSKENINARGQGVTRRPTSFDLLRDVPHRIPTRLKPESSGFIGHESRFQQNLFPKSRSKSRVRETRIPYRSPWSVWPTGRKPPQTPAAKAIVLIQQMCRKLQESGFPV